MGPRVLAVSYLFPNSATPGYGVFVLNRLRAVARTVAMAVVAPVQWYPFMKHLDGALSRSGGVPEEETIEGLRVQHPKFATIPRFLKSLESLTYYLALRSAVARLRKNGLLDGFDIVDAHWTYPDAVAGLLLARSTAARLIVTVRGHEALYREEISLRRWLLALALRRADAVVALSDELKAAVLRLGVSPGKVHVIPNGVDLSTFLPVEQRIARQRLGLPEEGQIVLSVGRLTRNKGHQHIIRAVAALRSRGLHTYIIGGVNPEDDFEGELRSLVGELEMDNVHFIGNVAHRDLHLWYSAADVFCLASHREGCPNVVLEALSCGTPVVASNVGAISEFVVPGENGQLVELAEIGGLVDTLRPALEKAWDRRAIHEAMLSRGWEDCARKVIALYEGVLRKSA
jgi:teichuronic acid biosynthesis glycosyltransferase TuaC